MKIRAIFQASVIINVEEKTGRRLLKKDYHSLDIETGDVSFIDDNDENYEYIDRDNGVEVEYTKLIDFEKIKRIRRK